MTKPIIIHKEDIEHIREFAEEVSKDGDSVVLDAHLVYGVMTELLAWRRIHNDVVYIPGLDTFAKLMEPDGRTRDE